jgi:hypothetical protein
MGRIKKAGELLLKPGRTEYVRVRNIVKSGWKQTDWLKIQLVIFFLLLSSTGCKTISEEREFEPFNRIEKKEHPRLIFVSSRTGGYGRTFDRVRSLYRTDKTFRKIFDKALSVDTPHVHPAMLAVCWIVSGDGKYVERAVEYMLTNDIPRSAEAGTYSTIWSYALAYDWLFHHPYFTGDKRKIVEQKIIQCLKDELDMLDKPGMALWHGRNQCANGAMIAGLAIADLPEQEENFRRATKHYIEALKALNFSEAWPEGPSYWIYNRAGPYALAADCVMTALNTNVIAGINISEVMRKTGLWHIYQFGPNEVFEPYGDSHGSITLGETGWWEVTTDYFAKLSRDPAVMAGADYIRNRSPVPYGRRPYYWYIALSYEPDVRPAKDYNPSAPELWMRKNMPKSMLFGRHSTGIAFFRNAWGDKNETFASFKAGDLLAHHDHYDTGHFSIQKAGVLTGKTGTYSAGYTSVHRLGYFIQTVSANSILVLAPGEKSMSLSARPDKVWDSLSGGQRVIRPTSFMCVSVEHFQSQRHAGPHLERGDIIAFKSVPGKFDYISADITASYNSLIYSEPGCKPKVSLVTRQFLYVRPEDVFIVYDRVNVTSPEFTPKFILHVPSKPFSDTERLIAGNSPDDGILETTSNFFVSENTDGGRLSHIILLPQSARTLKIGGSNYCFYVEDDGDQKNGFNGTNLAVKAEIKKEYLAKLQRWWRIEVEPVMPSTDNRFMNVLIPRLKTDESSLPAIELITANQEYYCVRVNKTIFVFSNAPSKLKNFVLEVQQSAECAVLDAVPNSVYRMGTRDYRSDEEGVLCIDVLQKGRNEIVFCGNP